MGKEYIDDADSSLLFDKEQLRSKSHEDGFFESLLHQHNRYLTPETESEEMVRDNETNYVNGYMSPNGPIKFMSKDAKEKVHMEIDARL